MNKMTCIRHGSVGFLLGMLLSLGLALSAQSAEPRPAVLFIGAPNIQDAALPLHELGIEMDTCVASNLAVKLASKKYNVVVPYVQYDKSLQKVLEDFMAGGGESFDEPESRERTRAGEKNFHTHQNGETNSRRVENFLSRSDRTGFFTGQSKPKLSQRTPVSCAGE